MRRRRRAEPIDDAARAPGSGGFPQERGDAGVAELPPARVEELGQAVAREEERVARREARTPLLVPPRQARSERETAGSDLFDASRLPMDERRGHRRGGDRDLSR